MIKALAVLEAGGKLEEYQYEPSELANNEVEISVSHCGVCHSDLSMINNDWGTSRYPLVPGHEVVGTVSRIGEGVHKHQVGDAVGLGWHASYCEQCDYCHSADHNLCAASRPTIIGRHGGFASKVVASQTATVSLPQGMDKASAGPLFCGGITVYNPLVQFDVKPTDRVAVIGVGGLGHLALQFLNAWGCEVTAFSSSASKAKEARELGAHHVLDSTNRDQLKAARNSFDFILCTVNVSLNWHAYLGTLAPRGRLHFVGMVTDPLAISVGALLNKQLQISASPVGSPSAIAEMLTFAKRHNIKPAIELFPFAQANEAIAKLAAGDVRYRAVLEL